MMQRDDFENRLGQGLKRWAQAGEPSMDLEALVKERLGETAGPSAAGTIPAVQKRKPRWIRWMAGLAAAAAVVMALGATFPTWARAAAGWPVVGPVVTEIIMKDAGLKWAYDTGLIQGTLAEAKEGDVTVRILGVMADPRRTTVIYQVTGLPAPQPGPFKPIQAGEELGRPRPTLPVETQVFVVGSKTGMSSSTPAIETPLGYVGTVSTLPLEQDTAELKVSFRLNGGQALTLIVPASRAATDRYSREVAINQSREIDGIKIYLESVTYTPAETILTYHEEKDSFSGPFRMDPETQRPYIEHKGKRLHAISGGSGINNRFLDGYPVLSEGSARLVIPYQVKGTPIEATWKLEEGAVQEVLGVPVTLTRIQRQGKVIALHWESPADEIFQGIAEFEAVDAQGVVYPLEASSVGGSWSSHILGRSFETELPDGVEPVAVRALQAGVLVKGPWVFELPR